MKMSEVWLLDDWSSAPETIKYNTSVMMEDVVPLGKDSYLTVTGDIQEISKYKIYVIVEEKQNDPGTSNSTTTE